MKQWLEMADEALEELGFIPPEDGEDDKDPPEPRSGLRPQAQAARHGMTA